MRFFFHILLFSLLILTSCKTKKKISVPSSRCKLDFKNAKTLTSLLKKNQVDFLTFNGKIKATVIMDEKGTDFTMSVRMKKDSVLWASVSPALGIEMLRFIATRDSIQFIDRLHKKYFTGTYDTLTSMLNAEVDLEVLQSLLLGNSVEFYEDDSRLRAGIDSCRYFLGTIRKRKFKRVMIRGKELKEPAQSIWLLDSTFKIVRLLFKEFDTKREFEAHFFDFRNLENAASASGPKVLIPFNSTFCIKTDHIITVNFEYAKAFANKPQSFPFTIPDGYERIKK